MNALGIAFLIFGSILVAAGAMALRLIHQTSPADGNAAGAVVPLDADPSAAASEQPVATSDVTEREVHEGAGLTQASADAESAQQVDVISRQS